MNHFRLLTTLSLALALSGLLAATPTAAQSRRPSGQSGSKAGAAAPRAQAPSGRTATPRAAEPRQNGGNQGGTQARRAATESNTRAGGSSGNRREGRVTPQDTRARERGDRPADGVAVPRGSSGGGRPHVPRAYRYPYYAYGYPYGYPYGYGYGYSYANPYWYDPFFWGFPGIGVGYPYGYSTYAYGGSSSYGGGQYGSAHTSIGEGGIRLKVKPRDAEVLVDGYYVGRVDDFDGVFQRLELASGPHRIEIRAEGYQPLGFDVRIPIDDTITYRGELERTTR
jgi:hypothetical protein